MTSPSGAPTGSSPHAGSSGRTTHAPSSANVNGAQPPASSSSSAAVRGGGADGSAVRNDASSTRGPNINNATNTDADATLTIPSSALLFRRSAHRGAALLR